MSILISLNWGRPPCQYVRDSAEWPETQQCSGCDEPTVVIYDTQTATVCLGLALLITVKARGGEALSYNGVLFFHLEEKLATVWRRWCSECMSLEQRQQLKQVEGQEK